MAFDWQIYRLKRLINKKLGVDYKKSYSQCGEDLIVRYIFDTLKIVTPSYLDIGAHHPTYLNNTRLFYDAGSIGVNVEPDPSLINSFKEHRPRDINLNIGVGYQSGVMPFYVMSTRTMNTFSEEDAQNVSRSGKIKIDQVITIPVVTVNDLINENFVTPPDLISLDVEGLDLDILRNLDLNRYRPKVLCVETITYSENRQGKKIAEIAELMQGNGYFIYADTYVNTLFVDYKIW